MRNPHGIGLQHLLPQGGEGGGGKFGGWVRRGPDPYLLVPNASRQEAEANFLLSPPPSPFGFIAL